MAFPDTRKLAMLDNELGNGSPASLFLGWFVTYPADAGTGGVEPSTGGYARSSAITNNATNFPAAAMNGATAEKKLATSTSLAASTGAQGTIAGFGLWDASSAGNLRAFAKPYGPPKVSTVVAATDLFTSTAHGFTADQVVRFEADIGSLPAGISAATDYYIISSGLTANDFKVSATLGGSAVDVTAVGTGTLRAFLSYAQPVGNATTVTVPANGLIFQIRTAV